MLTLFSWGYWGWGSTTKELVEAVDATEKAREYKPPVFVDIRIRRNVRAKGFSGGAFERVVGVGRYIWEPRLGNANVVAGRDGIKIKDPAAAKDLLETAVRLAKERQRIIFFCSCPSEDLLACHRNTVADLILNQAEKAGRCIEIVEWPGGTAVSTIVEVAPTILTAVARGRQTAPLSKNVSLSELSCLSWGSIVTLRAGSDSLSILTGPAVYQNGWALPVLERRDREANPGSLKASSVRLRKERGFEPRRT